MNNIWLAALVVAVLLIPVLQPVSASESLEQETLLSVSTQIDIMGILGRLMALPGVAALINRIMPPLMGMLPTLSPVLGPLLSGIAMLVEWVGGFIGPLVTAGSGIPVIGPFIQLLGFGLFSMEELLRALLSYTLGPGYYI